MVPQDNVQVKMQSEEFKTKEGKTIATYLSPGAVHYPDSPAWPYKHEVDSLTLHLSLGQKVFFAFLSLFDIRYWRGNRNDTMYYLRLCRATTEKIYFSHCFKLVIGLATIGSFYGVMGWGRFKLFGMTITKPSMYTDTDLGIFIGCAIIWIYIFRFVRSGYRDEEWKDVNNVRVCGVKYAVEYIRSL